MLLDEINRYLQEYGCWWFDPWWEQERWFKGIKLSQASFLGEIEFLKTIFTESWVKSLGDDPLQHPFLQMANFGQGLSQIGSLFSLAERLRFLTTVDGYEPVLNSYKSLQEARGADLEIFMAFVLGRVYQTVSFIRAKPKYGRTPDILVNAKISDFVIECKTVSDSQKEIWVDNYSRCFSQVVFSALPDHISVIYRPQAAEIDPKEYSCSMKGSYQIAAAIDAYLVLESFQFFHGRPVYVDLGHRGSVVLAPKFEGLSTCIHPPSISHAFIGRRLVENALIKANRQISGYGKPGVVAISYGYPPEKGALRLNLVKLFKQRAKEYEYVMGVLVFPAQNILAYIPPIWVGNPYSKSNPADFELPQALEAVLGPLD